MNNKSGSEPCCSSYPNCKCMWFRTEKPTYDELLKSISHLQKLCEEQKSRIEWLMNQPDNVLKSQCLSLRDKVEEQRVEIADRADTERSMAQAMLEDGEKIKELESQLAEKEKEKEIERLNRLLELTKNKWIEDTVKEGRVVLLQSQLATQTERVRVLEEALEKIADYPDEIASCAVAKQALNQESLGDGKDEYCTCGTDPRTWKTCRRHKESLGDGGKGE